MSTSIVQSPRLTARRGKAEHRLVRMTKAIGGTLSFSSLALSSAQFYRVSSATLGPGAFMLSIPKILCGSLAPFSAVVGAVGAACGLSALWLERSSSLKPVKRPRLGAPLVVVAGLAGAAMSAVYTRKVLASRGDFAAAFGTDWQAHIPSRLKGRMLPQRWTWHLSVAPGAHVERDVAFASPAFLPGILTSSDKAALLLFGLGYGLIGGGFLEELGWTGFAVPTLRRRHGVLTTGLIVGVLWGALHFLVFFWMGRPSGGLPLGLFLPLDFFLAVVGLTAFRVLMVWVYDRTESLLLAMLMHASWSAGTFILGSPAIAGVAFVTYTFAAAAVLWVVVAVVARASRGQLARQALPRGAA